MPLLKTSKITGLELLALIVVGSLVIAPFTCWRRSAEEERSVIRLWIHGEVKNRKLLVRAAELFNETHPDIKVKVEDQSGGSGRWVDKYLAAMQAGSCADVLYIHWKRISEFAAKDTLVAMDELVERDNYDLDGFFTGSVDAYRFADKLYAMPCVGSTMVMFYNKNLFDVAGIEYPNDEWTWDDFLGAAKKLTILDEAGRPLQVGCAPYDPSSWIWSAGGRYANADCTELYLSDPKTLAGLHFYVDLRLKHKVTTRSMGTFGDDPAAVDVFEKGRIAMDISGPWKMTKYSEIKTFDWDVTLFPKGPAGRHTRYAGMGFAIWTGSRKKDLAWELVKFMCGPEAGMILAENLADIPARREAAYSPTFLKDEYHWDQMAFLRALEPEHATVHTFPGSVRWPVVARAFDEQLDYVLIEQKSIEQAMIDSEREARRSIVQPAGTGDYIAFGIVGIVAAGLITWRFVRNNNGPTVSPPRRNERM